jgi:hypothetical protein
MYSLKKQIVIIFVLFGFVVQSQEIIVTRDFGVWIGQSFEKKVNKFEWNLGQQLRTFKNATSIDDYLVDLGLKYTINGNFKIATNIRYIYDKKYFKKTEQNYRYNLDFLYRTDFANRWVFTYRLRYQKEYVNLFGNYSVRHIHFSDFRNKAELNYDWNKPHKMYFSAEIFRRIEQYREPYFSKLRFYFGDKISTTIGEIDCSLGFDREILRDNPYSFLFIMLMYKIKL